MRGVVLAILLVALALPATAAGSTVTVRSDPETVDEIGGVAFSDEVYYVAASGEANDVLVAYAADAKSVTVTDPGATVTASGSCVSVDAHTARCTARPKTQNDLLRGTRVELGDSDDGVATTPASIGGVDADGGPGDDRLEGGAGPDELHGGGGTDTLLGRGDVDVLDDGDMPGAAGADVLDGGAGAYDTLSYDGRMAAVTVDLGRPGAAGEAGEQDTVRGVENVVGGAGDDRLTGDRRLGNRLDGNAGDDTLTGLGGVTSRFSDTLDGGAGDDVLDAGDGQDSLTGGTGQDRLSCGDGRDTVYDPEAGELLRRSCESVLYVTGLDGSYVWFPAYPRAATRRAVTFRLACPSNDELDEAPNCRRTLTLREASGPERLLGLARFANPRRRDSFEVRVRLTRTGRRLARRAKGVATTARISGKSPPKIAWTIRLRT